MVDTKKKIKKIILKTLSIKNNKINLDADKIKNWDSIAHLHIIAALEKQFKISFSSKEVSVMLNEKTIYNVIKKKLK
jgi:acyl carrier protein